MLLFAPPAPAFPADHVHSVPAYLRYEDLAQDGRIIPIALPPAMGGLWHHVLRDHPGHRAAISAGIVPILTRMVLRSLDQPIRVDHRIEARTGFALAHDLDAAGEVSKLFMNVWTEIHGAAGRLGARPPGPLAAAGQLFAEHTFTRLFAPPDQRRVTRLPIEGAAAVPELRYAAPPPASAGELPEGASWLGELAADPAEIAFTLDQTDSNQHVNSLVYIRVFLDAVQRRLAAGGHALVVRSREVEIAYRKPCFAGDRVRTHLRLFEAPGALGAAGYIEALAEPGRPRCYVRVVVGP
ncbi:MAG: hypothetical protein ACTHU0_31120 [Kofleriaceae bacterium]